MSDQSMQQHLAKYLLDADRMVVEPTQEMMQRFPLGAPANDEAAWLEAAARVLGDAVELRRPFLPSGKPKLAIKDRAILFNMTQARTLQDMAKDRKAKEENA